MVSWKDWLKASRNRKELRFVDVHARLPTVAQIGVAIESQFLAALLLDHAVFDDAAIFHGVHVEAEIGAGPHLAAQFEGVRGAAKREVLNAIKRIVAAADGPIVGQPEHFAVSGAVSDVGREETALARKHFQRFVIGGEVKNRHPLDAKQGMVRDGALAGKDVELGAGEPPPRFGNLAIGDEAIVHDVLSVHTLAPFAFEVERIAGGEQAGARNDLGFRGAAHVVEDARLGVHVVLGVIAVEFGAVQEIFVADVAPGLYVASVVVVIHGVGVQFLVRHFQMDVAAQVAQVAIGLLGFGVQRIFVGARRAGAPDFQPLVRDSQR